MLSFYDTLCTSSSPAFRVGILDTSQKGHAYSAIPLFFHFIVSPLSFFLSSSLYFSLPLSISALIHVKLTFLFINLSSGQLLRGKPIGENERHCPGERSPYTVPCPLERAPSSSEQPRVTGGYERQFLLFIASKMTKVLVKTA